MILLWASAEEYKERMRVKIRTANSHLDCWPCVTRDHPCWVWVGSRQKPDDRYGRFGFEARNKQAHMGEKFHGRGSRRAVAGYRRKGISGRLPATLRGPRLTGVRHGSAGISAGIDCLDLWGD